MKAVARYGLFLLVAVLWAAVVGATMHWAINEIRPITVPIGGKTLTEWVFVMVYVVSMVLVLAAATYLGSWLWPKAQSKP